MGAQGIYHDATPVLRTTYTGPLVRPSSGRSAVRRETDDVIDPGVLDDSTRGYLAGSTWRNTISGKVWHCRSASVGAADWVDLTASGGGSPAGEATELQFRNGDSFGAVTGSAWNGTTLSLPPLNVAGNVNIGAGYGLQINGTTMFRALTATHNHFLGEGAGGAMTGTGLENDALGWNALASQTTGFANVCVGSIAGNQITTGNENTIVGTHAGRIITTGEWNVAVGTDCLRNGITSSHCVGVGAHALFANTANNITAVGSNALAGNTTGTNNTGIGYVAVSGNTTGTHNTGVGHAVLSSAITDSRNTAVGAYAGLSVAGGSNNTLIGSLAGFGMTSGAKNVVIGSFEAHYDKVTSGQQNIVIGYDCAPPSATANGQLSIANMIYGTGLTGTGTTVSTGMIGIANKAPAAALDIVNLSNLRPTLRLKAAAITTVPIFEVLNSANAVQFAVADGLTTLGVTRAASGLAVTGAGSTVVTTGCVISSGATYDQIQSYGGRAFHINPLGNAISFGGACAFAGGVTDLGNSVGFGGGSGGGAGGLVYTKTPNGAQFQSYGLKPIILNAIAGTYVVVGGTTHDGSSALQVHGAAKIGGNLLPVATGSHDLGTALLAWRTAYIGTSIVMADGADLSAGTASGSKLGTTAATKLGFWGATPVVQPSLIADAAEDLADVTAKLNTLLGQHRTIGLMAAA